MSGKRRRSRRLRNRPLFFRTKRVQLVLGGDDGEDDDRDTEKHLIGGETDA